MTAMRPGKRSAAGYKPVSRDKIDGRPWPLFRWRAKLIQMFKLENVIQLKPEERIRLITKRHAATIFPRLVLALLLIVTPFFFLFPLLKTGPTGIVVFSVCVGVGVLVAWRTFVMWDGEALIVSNQRIVKVTQSGFFSRTVTEASLDRLADISWRKRGLMGTVFNFGDLTINTTGQQRIAATHMPSPREIHALLVEVLDLMRTRAAVAVLESDARAKRLHALIDEMDDSELVQLERAISKSGREEAISSLFRPERAVEERADGAVAIAVKRFEPSETIELKPLSETDNTPMV